MRNIVLARIDDRLIHGQIVTSWCKATSANRILIVDEALSKDSFTQRLLKAAAPSDIAVDILGFDQAVQYLMENDRGEDRIILLTKTPKVMEDLINQSISIKTIILGGMGAKTGRSRLNKNISASVEEVECIKRIISNGTEMFYQLVPAEHPVNVKKFI
ncbi:MAG: PTS sugar transporter subunit IIB [Anaerolineaceae bacterium]